MPRFCDPAQPKSIIMIIIIIKQEHDSSDVRQL